MKKNFVNPEINIESFDLGMNIVTISGLTAAESELAQYILGVEISDNKTDKSGYVYSIKQESLK